jgi:hypothetical protein
MRKERQDIKLLQEGEVDEEDITIAKAKYRITSNDYTKFSEAMELPQQRERVYADGLKGNLSTGKGVTKLVNQMKMEYNSIALEEQLEFLDIGGAKRFIPRDTLIQYPTIIAGGTKKAFRKASEYVEKYGGKESEWFKYAGKVESEKYIFDIHYVESNGKRYDWKIKNKTLKGKKVE